ncbi:MAG: hypothetical protein QM820_03060 [Minicystis sp.]
MRADHVHLRHHLLGFLPLPAQRIPLEWDVGRDDEPDYSPSDGIIFSTPAWSRDFDVVCFGPTDDATADPLVAEIAARMVEARRTLSAGDAGRERRRGSGDLYPLFRALDPASIERNAWGRVSRAVLRADADFAGVTLARGSTLHLARTDVWLAPGTPDRIASVDLAARTRLRPLGRTLRAGATLHWNDARVLVRIERGFDGEVEMSGLRADGGKDFHFDDRGRLWGFTTTVPLRIRGSRGAGRDADRGRGLVAHAAPARGRQRGPPRVPLHHPGARRAHRPGEDPPRPAAAPPAQRPALQQGPEAHARAPLERVSGDVRGVFLLARPARRA